MANETTSTSWTSQILSEALADRALPAAGHPKFVALNLINIDSIDGEASKVRKYAKLTDLGAASSATEGTALSTNTVLARDTALSVTPTEAAAIMSEVTNQAVRRKVPGMPSNAVQALFENGTTQQLVAALGEDAERLARACMETAEDTVLDSLGTFSNTVGTSGSDLTIAQLVEAQYTLKTLEAPHEDWVYCLTPNQIYEAQLALGVTSGGIGGSVWFQQADASMVNANTDANMNGFRGSFMGVPMYECSHSIRTTANAAADVAGALMLRGRGTPDGGQIGGIVLVEGAPLYFATDFDILGRAITITCIYEFATAEVNDSFGVSIITDNV